jgi:hypothetical protein
MGVLKSNIGGAFLLFNEMGVRRCNIGMVVSVIL